MPDRPEREARLRITSETQMVLAAMLRLGETYGRAISSSIGLATGTVHPILARLEAAGWAESRWEDIDSRGAGRPARRYYRLSAAGTIGANRAVEALRAKVAAATS